MCALAAPRDEYKRDFQRTAALPAGRMLRVDHSLGPVTIRTQEKAEVGVTAAIRCSADSAAEAKSFCDAIQIRVEDTGSGVSVRTDYPKSWSHRNLGYSVKLDIVMPQASPLDLRNRFGDVTVQSLHAPATVNNSNGNVVFTGGRGKQRIENSFGDVEVLSNEGDVAVASNNGRLRATDINGAAELSNRFGDVRVTNVTRGLIVRGNNMQVEAERVGGIAEISSSFGDVRVLDAKANVTVHNQNGKVTVNSVAGAADLQTTFAEIRFSGITRGLNVRAQNAQVTGDNVGESAVIETSFGGVDLRTVKGGARVTAQNSPIRLTDIAGEVYAKTTFAATTVENIGGPITVESQNGMVTASGRPGAACKPIALRTTFAPIRVTVANGVGYTVSARTTFGKIHSEAELTVNGQIGEGVIEGKIAGGGCELRLIGQNGNIEIVKR
jgi:DUF4097 and DUF4098 domain-containing protein YvlB